MFFVCLQLCALVVAAIRQIETTSMSRAKWAICLVCALVLAATSLFHQVYSLHSSDSAQGILGWWILADAVSIRSQWLRHSDRALIGLTFVLLFNKLWLLLLEEADKRSLLRRRYSDSPPESLAGLWNRLLLVWINPLMYTGVFGKALTLGELWEVEEEFSSGALRTKIMRLSERRKSGKKTNLLWSSLREFSALSLLPFPTRIVQAAFSFAQPFLVERTLVWYASPVTAESESTGYGLLGAFACVYVGFAVRKFRGLFRQRFC